MVFISFGGSSDNYVRRVKQICEQAKKLNIFSECIPYTHLDLINDVEFWNKHGEFISSNSRGYGYWLWKPYIIQKTLSKLNENDILVYADAGCNLNFRTRKSWNRFGEYIQMVNGSELGLLSFQMIHLEYQYTKKQTRDAIFIPGVDSQEDIDKCMNSGQCMATAMIMRKNKHTSFLMNRWYSLSENHDFINDVKTEEEHPKFIDHRHDQSIYSLLVKKYGSIKIPDETFFHPNWNTGLNYPIWATRQRW